jgi:hypothetical protein
MKKLVLAWFATLAFFAGQAQIPVTLTFFAEAGERFWVVIDGQRQNDQPLARVEVSNLTKPIYRAKIIFEDDKIKSIGQTVSTLDFDEKPVHTTYVVTRRHPITGRTGKMRMFISGYEPATMPKPAASTPPPPAAHPEPVPTSTQPQTEAPTPAQAPPVETAPPAGQPGNVTININVPTSAPAAANHDRRNRRERPQQQATNPTPVSTPTPPPAPEVPKCPEMETADFNAFVGQLRNQSFENTRLNTANGILRSHCLTVNQIRTIMETFSFEKSRLDFAKAAYGRAVDPGRYFMLNDLFSFSSSVEELTNFIGNQ